jgi:chromosome segregation and condensation protein ScpB
MSRWTVSRVEAREVARRDRRTRQKGGATLADVESDMRRDMVKELRRMARSYSGKPRETRELLEAIVIAETEGITTEDLADVLDVLRVKLEKRAA